MALFSKLNEKMNINKIKEEAVIVNENIENEVLFGNFKQLLEDIDTAEAISSEIKTIKTEGEHNADIQKDVNDDVNHDNKEEVPGSFDSLEAVASYVEKEEV